MEFIRIEPGSFVMGSPADEPYREDQEVLHQVTLTQSFYLGRFEVTQGEWEAVMGENPSRFQDCGSDCPVENVNYQDIEAFVRSLEELSGQNFRLPTEAEWEYSCRAGEGNVFGIGERISSVLANFDGSDHCPYPEGFVVDPLARCGAKLRVIRGGSWYYGPDSARCGLRYTHRPIDDGPSLGFRLVWEAGDRFR